MAANIQRRMSLLVEKLDSYRRQCKTFFVNERADGTIKLEAHIAQRNRELTAAFEISRKIVAQLDLQQLLPLITSQAQLLTKANSANLCLLTPNGAHLNLVAHNGEVVTLDNHLAQPIEQGLAKQVIGQGDTVTVASLCSNCNFLNTRTPGKCAATPLRIGEQTLGALCVVRPVNQPFDSNETRALTLLANSAAIAIVNARLVEAERYKAEQAAAVAERERLAAEFHDHLAQTLSFLNFKVDQALESLDCHNLIQAETELSQMKTALDGAYTQVRAALTGLREPLIVENDLNEQLATCLTNFQEQTGLSAKLDINNSADLVLAYNTQKQVMLIIRESLANIRRHAQAHHVKVSVTQDSIRNEACFAISDDGDGFDIAGVSGENHLGLKIMQVRAERSGGRLSISSAPGIGTNVVAYFPLESHSVKNGR